VQATELAQTLETVGKLAQLNAGSSGGAALLQLVEQARATARHASCIARSVVLCGRFFITWRNALACV
jgi:hypothetical protein